MGLFDRISETGQLIRNSMALAAQNPAILQPTFRQLAFGFFFYFLLVAGLAVFFLAPDAFKGAGVLVALAGAVLLVLLFPFIKFYYRAAQAWLVYKTFRGEKPLLAEGLARARQNKGDIFALTVADIVLTYLASRLKSGARRGGMGLVTLVMFLLGKAVEEAWDLAGNYLLPAAIIPEQNVAQSIRELPRLKENVPASLVGVFGIDFAGDAVKGYLGLLFFLSLLAAAAFYLLFKALWLAALVILAFIAIFFAVGIFVDMAKTIYFTAFYVLLTRRQEIAPAYVGVVESYLAYKGAPGAAASGAGTASSALAGATRASSGAGRGTGFGGQQVTARQQHVALLASYVEKYRRSGYSDEQIRGLLVQNHWPEDIVQQALQKASRV